MLHGISDVSIRRKSIERMTVLADELKDWQTADQGLGQAIKSESGRPTYKELFTP